MEREHQAVNDVVARLEDLDLADPGREPLLQRLADLLHEDVRDEEDELLPRLQQQLTLGQMRRLGLLWEVVRRVSPTRAHPVPAGSDQLGGRSHLARIPAAASARASPYPVGPAS